MDKPITEPGARSSRVRGLDAARVVASLATVFYHAARSEEFDGVREAFRFAVSYFSLVAAFFLVSSLRRRPDQPFLGRGGFAGKKAVRLILPFVGWSLVYYVLSEAQNRMRGSPSAHRDWTVLIEGTNYVLWFLPYLLVCSLIAFPVVRFAVRRRGREVALGTVLLVAGVAMSLWPLTGDLSSRLGDEFWPHLGPLHVNISDTSARNLSFVADKWWGRAPAFLWGLGLTLLWRPRDAGGTGAAAAVSGAGSAMGLVGFLGIGAAAVALGHSNALDNLMGLMLFVIALGPTPLSREHGLARFGVLTYGIYLSHQIFVLVLQFVLDKQGFPHRWWTDLGVFAAAAAAAILATLVLRKFRWTRWLAP